MPIRNRGAGNATEETLSRFHQVGKENANNPQVGNALFELLDLINQRCERRQWLSFVASYRDAFSDSLDGQVMANVNDAEQWLTLEKASVAR